VSFTAHVSPALASLQRQPCARTWGRFEYPTSDLWAVQLVGYRQVPSHPTQRFFGSLPCSLIGGEAHADSKTKITVFSGIGFPVKKTILLPPPCFEGGKNHPSRFEKRYPGLESVFSSNIAFLQQLITSAVPGKSSDENSPVSVVEKRRMMVLIVGGVSWHR
jgi:hypothetical protein